MTKMRTDCVKYIYQCSQCPKKFRYDSEKKRHEKSHYPQYECNICNKKFSFLSALKRHRRQHDRTGMVYCKDCGGAFKDEALLKRHIKYAHNDESFTCTECSAYFSSKIALRTHSKTHNVGAQKQYRCTFEGCEKAFNFPHHLKHHEFTHTGSKQHFCNICGKGFIQGHHLKTHLKVHEPDVWLICGESDCSKKFPNKYALKRHMSTHNNKNIIELSPRKKKVIETSKPKKTKKSKGCIICNSCGQTLNKRQASRHALLCNNKEENIRHLPDNNIQECNSPLFTKETSIDKLDEVNTLILSLQSKQDDISKIDFINNCKNAVGGCLVSTDGSVTDNCLCAKMAKYDNAADEITTHNIDIVADCEIRNPSYTPTMPAPAIVENRSAKFISMPVIVSLEQVQAEINRRTYVKDILKKPSVSDNSEKSTFRKCGDENFVCDCMCAKKLNADDESITQVYKNNNNKQLEDFNANNIYKDTHVAENSANNFDSRQDIVYENALNLTTKETDYNKKSRISDEQSVPYNSCKAIFGHCIVSDDGTIGEGCLCAKMSRDIAESAQEIDELTPLSSLTWN